MADERLTLDDLTEVTTLQTTDVVLIKRPGGSTLKVEVGDLLALVKPADSIHSATAKTSLADADEMGLADSASAFSFKKFTLSSLISSIFKTARTIANAQFASASFKLFNAAGTPRSLAFNTAALTADRVVTMPDSNVDLSNVTPPDVKAWVNFNGTGTVAIRASKNVSSLVDNGVGDYTVNFTTPIADANYAVSGSLQQISGGGQMFMIAASSNPTTTSVRISLHQTNVGQIDSPYVNVVITR